MARRVSSDSAGSPHGLSQSGSGMASPTSSQGAATSPSQQKRRNEDDFFNKAKYYRDIVKVQEPEMEDTSALDSMLTVNEQPLSDLEDDTTTPKKAPEVVKAPEKPKRKRELSLTPPPEQPTRQYRRVDPSIGLIELDDDNGRNDDLDPELASIAAQITFTSQQSVEGVSPAGSGTTSSQQGLSQSPVSQFSNSQSSTSNPAFTTIPTTNDTASQGSTLALASPGEDGSEPELINILLRWRDHPQIANDPVSNPLHAKMLEQLRLPIKVVVKANKSFRELMEHYCHVKYLPFSEVVFTFRNARLMPSSTPESLEFPRFAVIDVYNVFAYKLVKNQEAQERSMKLAELERQEAELARMQAPTDSSESNEAQQDSEEADADYLYIKLRGKDTTDLRVRVKPSTTVQAILSHYKNQKKIDADTPIRLEFDDEAMDPSTTVGNTDIENDDMLLVRIG
ncbi:hypothetical protein BGZ70_006053 [Mortierella alpina]|uniref:Rad60/SUMO-like domain-containing protein n=1 Tax=Mortierella alpina TaxID=64518 RepID=A0A9P6J8A0_MORAP|nr:hypothetical protein BGZ70_006053 [Mortierella alpina]